MVILVIISALVSFSILLVCLVIMLWNRLKVKSHYCEMLELLIERGTAYDQQLDLPGDDKRLR